MQASFKRQYPIVGRVTVAIADWWRKRALARKRAAELDACGREESERIAHDLGMSAAELRALASRGPDAADLLLQRMAALRLDPKEFARTNGPLLRDLQRLCSLCDSHRRCAKDLARDPRDAVWEQYCPNAGTLGALQALEQTLTRICPPNGRDLVPVQEREVR